MTFNNPNYSSLSSMKEPIFIIEYEIPPTRAVHYFEVTAGTEKAAEEVFKLKTIGHSFRIRGVFRKNINENQIYGNDCPKGHCDL